jgi:hypothetical protein
MAQQLGIFFKALSLVIASTSPSLRYMTTSLYPFAIHTTGFFHEHLINIEFVVKLKNQKTHTKFAPI